MISDKRKKILVKALTEIKEWIDNCDRYSHLDETGDWLHFYAHESKESLKSALASSHNGHARMCFLNAIYYAKRARQRVSSLYHADSNDYALITSG